MRISNLYFDLFDDFKKQKKELLINSHGLKLIYMEPLDRENPKDGFIGIQNYLDLFLIPINIKFYVKFQSRMTTPLAQMFYWIFSGLLLIMIERETSLGQ